MTQERLQKVLAAAGVASRRESEGLIAAGRVTVNGQVVCEPGTKVDSDHDEITVDGRPVRKPTRLVYVMLHKPSGVVSTASDPQGRPTVVSLVDIPERIFPVGRLDFNSEGLLLLTNDGALTHRMTHPSFEVEKEYHALLTPVPDKYTLSTWSKGVLFEGKKTAPAQIDIIGITKERAWVRIVMHEGRKRQIREVAQLLGHTTLRLIRVREGTLSLGDLPSGQWRELTSDEVKELAKAH